MGKDIGLSLEARALLDFGLERAWSIMSEQGRLPPFALVYSAGEISEFSLTELARVSSTSEKLLPRAIFRTGIIKISGHENDALLIDLIISNESICLAQPLERKLNSNRLTASGTLYRIDKPIEPPHLEDLEPKITIKGKTFLAEENEFVKNNLVLISDSAKKVSSRDAQFVAGLGVRDLPEALRLSGIREDYISRISQSLQWLLKTDFDDKYFLPYVADLMGGFGNALDNIVICCADKNTALNTWRGRANWTVSDRKFCIVPILEPVSNQDSNSLTSLSYAGLLGKHLMFLPHYRESSGWELHEWVVGLIAEIGAFVGHSLLSLWVRHSLPLGNSQSNLFAKSVSLDSEGVCIDAGLYQLCTEGFRLGAALEAERILFDSYSARSGAVYGELLKSRISETKEYAVFALRNGVARAAAQRLQISAANIVEIAQDKIESIRAEVIKIAGAVESEDIAA